MKISKRKITQLTTAILYNLNFRGFRTRSIYKGSLKKMCVPGLNCYSCPLALNSCPLGSFQSFLAKENNNFLNRIPFYVLGLIILFGIILGRVICGFLCPFGLIQELLFKIKTKKIIKNNMTRRLTIIKYVILLVFVILIPLMLNQPGFCKYICPAGTFEAGIPNVILNKQLREIIGLLFTWKVFIMLIVLILSVFMFRFFCRFICPLGAIYGLLNKTAFFSLKVDEDKCIHCNRCVNECLMDVKSISDRECIECGECISKCKVNAIYRC